MKKCRVALLIAVSVMIMLLPVTGVNSATETTITVDRVEVQEGGSVSVPFRLSNNVGILGATLTIRYDEDLVLTNVAKGTALPTLVMTNPGNLSANPINIVWDGMEADITNGTIVILTFTVPDKAGTYDISVSYKNEDIIDGNLLPVGVSIQNGGIVVSGEESQELPTISIGTVDAQPGEQVDVPISISGNTGMCGATLSIAYNDALVLSNITAGSALSTLTMTKPGSLSSNPFNLVWDGMEADSSNGVIAILTFTAPDTAGIYNIAATYNKDNMLDGDLRPFEIKIEQGRIKAGSVKQIVVKVDGKSVTLSSSDEVSGDVIIGFYSENNKLLSMKTYKAVNGDINLDNQENAYYAKAMWWERLGSLLPKCDAQRINLNN